MGIYVRLAFFLSQDDRLPEVLARGGGGGDSLPWFSGPRCPDSVLSAASRFDDLHTTHNKDYWGYDVGGELENGFVKSPAAVESLRYVV